MGLHKISVALGSNIAKKIPSRLNLTLKPHMNIMQGVPPKPP